MYYRYWMHADDAHNVCSHYGIRTERYKLIYFYGQRLGMTGSHDKPLTPEWELYDLQSDPAEMHNIYKDPSNEGLIKELKNKLLELKTQYDDLDSKYPVLDNLNKTYFW